MYHWRIEEDTCHVEGYSRTLHDAIDALVRYANGRTIRDFYVNGHHMNQEFNLWIDGGRVMHDTGEEFVPMNDWYEKLGGQPERTEVDVLGQVTEQLHRIFRPQPTRGSAPANPATLLAKGDSV